MSLHCCIYGITLHKVSHAYFIYVFRVKRRDFDNASNEKSLLTNTRREAVPQHVGDGGDPLAEP